MRKVLHFFNFKQLIIFALMFTALMSLTMPASAHPLTASSLNITVKEKQVDLKTVIPLDAFNKASGLTIVTNEDLTSPEVSKYIDKNVKLSDAEGQLNVEIKSLKLDDSRGVKDVVAEIVASSEHTINGDITVKNSLVISSNKSHSIYLYLVSDWQSGTLPDENPISLGILGNFNDTYLIVRGEQSPIAGFINSVQLGFSHIQGGYDHLLFLAMLLVPAPLIAGRKGTAEPVKVWKEKRTWKTTLKQTLWIVSAFTVGHSLSLIVVTLTHASYSSLAVEFLVAGSVGIAAAHAVKPLVQRGEIWIAGIFGLVHGTAFAGTLQNLNLETWPLVQALVGFNIGIELAQLTALAVFLPLIWFASRWKYYYIVRVSLAVAGLIACIFWIANLIPAN